MKNSGYKSMNNSMHILCKKNKLWFVHDYGITEFRNYFLDSFTLDYGADIQPLYSWNKQIPTAITKTKTGCTSARFDIKAQDIRNYNNVDLTDFFGMKELEVLSQVITKKVRRL